MSAGADSHQNVASTAKSRNLPAENMLIAIVVPDRRQRTGVRRERDGRQRLPRFLPLAHELSCEVLAVGRRTAVAAEQDLVAARQAVAEDLVTGLNVSLNAVQVGEQALVLEEGGLDH